MTTTNDLGTDDTDDLRLETADDVDSFITEQDAVIYSITKRRRAGESLAEIAAAVARDIARDGASADLEAVELWVERALER